MSRKGISKTQQQKWVYLRLLAPNKDETSANPSTVTTQPSTSNTISHPSKYKSCVNSCSQCCQRASIFTYYKRRPTYVRHIQICVNAVKKPTLKKQEAFFNMTFCDHFPSSQYTPLSLSLNHRHFSKVFLPKSLRIPYQIHREFLDFTALTEIITQKQNSLLLNFLRKLKYFRQNFFLEFKFVCLPQIRNHISHPRK